MRTSGSLPLMRIAGRFSLQRSIRVCNWLEHQPESFT
jgi:hypothetical protein